MKWLFLLALLPFCYGTSEQNLLGAEKCTWGPGYWCQGLKESAACQTTKHCIDYQWTKYPPAPADDDDICSLCKEMIKEARDTLESNETQEGLKKVLEGSCALIPIQVIADECKKLSDEFIPELIEVLASEMDPTTVCTVSGLCNSAKIDKLLANYYQSNSVQLKSEQKSPSNSNCNICQTWTKKIANKARGVGKAGVIDFLMAKCGEADSYSDMCRQTIAENGDDIYRFLSSMDNGFCTLVGMCMYNEQSTTVTSVDEDVECEFCEKVIKHWVDTWTANTTQAELKQVLEALCHHISDPVRSKRCLHIVDDWYIPFFNYILHDINAHELCSWAGICSFEQLQKVASKEIPITYLSLDKKTNVFIGGEERLINSGSSNSGADNVFTGGEEQLINSGSSNLGAGDVFTGGDERLINSGSSNLRAGEVFTGGEERLINSGSTNAGGLIGGYFVPATVTQMSKPGCIICEYVMHELEDVRGLDPAIIEQKVRRLCQIMPDSVEVQCNAYVSTYEPVIVKLVARGMSGPEVCLRLGLCKDNLLHQQASMPSAELQVLRRSNDNCALCELALNTVYGMLNDTSDQRAIKNALDAVCDRLPKSISNECVKLVNEYSVPIFKLIINEFTPEQICSEIHMCKEAPKPEPKDDEKCVLCEYAVSTLEKIVEDKHNQDEVRQGLDKLCQLLPNSIKDECEEFVNTYADMLIDLLAHDLTPDEVCQALGLCKKEKLKYQDRLFCSICESALTEVESVISDDTTEEEVEKMLDKVCYKFSKPELVNACINFVKENTEKVINMFVHDYTPEEICTTLHLCDAFLKPRSHSANEIDAPLTSKQTLPKDSDFCVMCEYAMELTEKEILSENNIDFAERFVEFLCSYMPQSVAKTCFKFVDTYGDQIIHLIIEDGLDPKVVCTSLSICSDQKKLHDASMLGGRRCAWGPSYWCASPFHAQACGTTKHCLKHIWN